MQLFAQRIVRHAHNSRPATGCGNACYLALHQHSFKQRTARACYRYSQYSLTAAAGLLIARAHLAELCTVLLPRTTCIDGFWALNCATDAASSYVTPPAKNTTTWHGTQQPHNTH